MPGSDTRMAGRAYSRSPVPGADSGALYVTAWLIARTDDQSNAVCYDTHSAIRADVR
jgi:hypothetical protein